MEPTEPLDEPRQDARRDDLEAADAQRAAKCLLLRIRRGLEVLGLGEEPARFREEGAPGLRELAAFSALPDEQLGPERALEIGERGGERGLGEEELIGGRLDAPGVGRGHKIRELPERVWDGHANISDIRVLRYLFYTP